ncbi:alpha carbonic anhydrase [Chytriomyces cf. hyalinus JEL632]|nr:alpha carbonic anhydrase [Chytriomyces cf. hyalinus JEL632]
MLVTIAAVILSSSLSALAAPVPETVSNDLKQNCLADVISTHGLEKQSLQRRASSWSYEGDTGAAKWGALSFDTCATGRFQSPIDFKDEQFAIPHGPALTWDEWAHNTPLENTGHTVQLQFNETSARLLTRDVNGGDTKVQQAHFHSPSEHHINGKCEYSSCFFVHGAACSKYLSGQPIDFPLELHFVHVSDAKKISVLGVFFELGPWNPWLDQFITQIPEHEHQQNKLEHLYMGSMYEALMERNYFSYSGSLTVPPCTEEVLWMVAREPVTISDAQLALFRDVMPFNSRPTQQNESGKSKGVPEKPKGASAEKWEWKPKQSLRQALAKIGIEVPSA